MQTPTLDHTERHEPGTCACKPWSLCPGCAKSWQRFRYEVELSRFLAEFGTEPVRAEREKPVLRLVR